MNTGGHRRDQAVPTQAGDQQFPAQDSPPVLWPGVNTEWNNQTGKSVEKCSVNYLFRVVVWYPNTKK